MKLSEKKEILRLLEDLIKDFNNWVIAPFSQEKPCQVRRMLAIQNNAFNIAEMALRLDLITYDEWEDIVNNKLLIQTDEPDNCGKKECTGRLENGRCKYNLNPCDK